MSETFIFFHRLLIIFKKHPDRIYISIERSKNLRLRLLCKDTHEYKNKLHIYSKCLLKLDFSKNWFCNRDNIHSTSRNITLKDKYNVIYHIYTIKLRNRFDPKTMYNMSELIIIEYYFNHKVTGTFILKCNNIEKKYL
jgi:hypothetical protein